MTFRFVCCLLFLAPIACHCQDIPTPKVSGYVTSITSPSVFDVNGQHIQVTSKTKITLEQSSSLHGNETTTTISPQDMHLYLGEPAEVYGEANRKIHTVAANRLDLHARKQHDVSGFGIIDAVPPLPAGASPTTDRLFRADGYAILIVAASTSTFDKPLTSLSDINVNVWISYRGRQRADGVVVADQVRFKKHDLRRAAEKLREKWEYDPASVDASSHQSGLDKGFRGVDPSKFPPYKDQAAQARIDAIGAKLVPRYQALMPTTEATRISLRFYLVDAPKWKDAVALPSGIILVPFSEVQKLPDDSQLAVVLADKIAWLIEEQPLVLPATAKEVGMSIGEGVLIDAIPGAALVDAAAMGPMIGISVTESRHRREQRDRVSLSLLKDAGFDVTQAPIAWWLLASKNPKTLAEIPLPRRAAYLYEFLGEASQPQ